MIRDGGQTFWEGLTFWWRGWRYLSTRRSLILLTLIPLLLSLTAAVVGIYFLLQHLSAWVSVLVAWIMGASSGFWATLIYYPVYLTSSLLLLLISLIVTYLAHGLIAIPFYSLLADRACGRLGLKKDLPFQWGDWLRTSLHMWRAALMKAVLFVFMGIILFVLSFVPVLNVVAVMGTLMLVAFDLLDYSFEVLGMGFRERIRWVRAHRLGWIGMAAGLALTLLVPGLTLLVTPGAVVGGALLVKAWR